MACLNPNIHTHTEHRHAHVHAQSTHTDINSCQRTHRPAHRCVYSHKSGPQTENALSDNNYRLGQTVGGEDGRRRGRRAESCKVGRDEGGGQSMKLAVTRWMEALTENWRKLSLQGSRKQHCHVTDRYDWSAVT